MARLGVDYETIKQTAVKLLSQGTAPSVQKIREVLGTGSNTTIAEHLKVWREDYAKKAIHHLPANMPQELISAFEIVWQTAMEQAQHQLVEYKQAIENDSTMAQQRTQDAEKMLAAYQQKMAESSVTLEQELAAKQQLGIELALANERLSTQVEAAAAQKHQYEDRLKRVYDENDRLLAQCHQLQKDALSLQEKIALQSTQYENSIAQHHVHYQQSENRWVKLIDQTRNDAKDTEKKLENLRVASTSDIKNLKNTLSELQQTIFEKNTQLNRALDHVNELKQEVKTLNVEMTTAKAIMKRNNVQKPKSKIAALVKNKQEDKVS